MNSRVLIQPRTKNPAGWLALVFLCAFAVGGCVESSATVKGTWAESVPHDKTYSKVLIVGVTPDYTQRCAFEWAMASRINSESTVGFVSCDTMGKDVQLTRENIEAAVASLHADSVLATTLIATKMGVGQVGSTDTRGGGYYKATDYGFGYDYGYAGGFGGYGMPTTVTYFEFQSSPGLPAIKGAVHMVSHLYETHNADLIYTVNIEASTHDVESTSVAITGVAQPIVDRLRKDNLIR
jgi:hypothetical protein